LCRRLMSTWSGVSSIFWDHEDVHTATSDCPVFQSGKEHLEIPWLGFAVESIALEHLNSSLVEFGSFWCGIVSDAISGKCWS